MPDSAEVEIGQKRFWRAKEILQGRLAGAGYDPELFARYADVLAAMHDDDEAGRFDLLAGRTEGPAGARARAFLTRRSKRSFAQLWAEMPAACRRAGALRLPQGTIALLNEYGHSSAKIDRHLANLARPQQQRRKRILDDPAAVLRGQRTGLVIGALLLVILAVGVVGTMQIVMSAFVWLYNLL